MAGPWEKYKQEEPKSQGKPWEKYKTTEQEPELDTKEDDPSGAIGAGVVGFGQALTFDNLDELVAGARTLFDSEEEYQKELKRVQANYDKLREEHPDAFQIGSAVPLVAGAGVVASKTLAAKAAKSLFKNAPKIKKAATELLTSPNKKQAIKDLAKRELKDVLVDKTKSAAGKAPTKSTKVFDPFVKSNKDRSELSDLKQVISAVKKDK